MVEENKDAWDATQWHEVKKGETLWKIAETYYGTALSIQKSLKQTGTR
jgi:LysM repeat protein